MAASLLVPGSTASAAADDQIDFDQVDCQLEHTQGLRKKKKKKKKKAKLIAAVACLFLCVTLFFVPRSAGPSAMCPGASNDGTSCPEKCPGGTVSASGYEP